jgi:hypothetical protein
LAQVDAGLAARVTAEALLMTGCRATVRREENISRTDIEEYVRERQLRDKDGNILDGGSRDNATSYVPLKI